MDKMDVYVEKAKELGELILASEESINLADCRAVFEEDEEAKARLEEYTKYQEEVQLSLESGALDQESFKNASRRLQEMGGELKKHPVVGELIRAEGEFNFFVNRVMSVIKNTITGEEEHGCGGSCGDCGGSCGHSH